MGLKRPFGEENLPELSFKQPKQFDDSIQNAMYMTNDLPSDVLRIDCAGEPNCKSCQIQITRMFENGETICFSAADNESERTSARVENLSQSEQHKQLCDNIKFYSRGSFSSTATSDEDVDSETEDFSSAHTVPRYCDISKPSRLPHQYLDPYVASLNSSPLKEVPVGPDHQADLPNWDPLTHRRDSPTPDVAFLGICVVPMPSLYILGLAENAAGHGRTDCSCGDVGSRRCVRQHVSEARERLQESLSHRAFRDLGFYSMGEEVVACDWSPDERRLFCKVVVSSPPSRGQKFWELLSFVFPNRTKEGIVSYYFNVFMLRRRAFQNRSCTLDFQNRSCTLDVDSDDDETLYGDEDWNGGGNGVILASKDFNSVDVGEEEEWTDDRDLDVGWTGGYRPRPGNFCGEDGKGSWDHFGMGDWKGERL